MLVVYVTHSWTRAREKRYIDDNDDESKQLVVATHSCARKIAIV